MHHETMPSDLKADSTYYVFWPADQTFNSEVCATKARNKLEFLKEDGDAKKSVQHVNSKITKDTVFQSNVNEVLTDHVLW